MAPCLYTYLVHAELVDKAVVWAHEPALPLDMVEGLVQRPCVAYHQPPINRTGMGVEGGGRGMSRDRGTEQGAIAIVAYACRVYITQGLH
jgi:hypothetical protein